MSGLISPPASTNRSSRPTRVAIAQLDPTMLDLSANIDASVSAVIAARSRGAEVIVLPELCLSGYMFDSAAEVEACAITSEHGVFSRWAGALAGTDALVIGGFAEREGDTFYISAALVGADGVLAVYRKTHLWNREKRFFTAGSSLPPIIETPFGRISVLICYDLEFPEMARSAALRGADLVAVPTNWALATRPYGDEPPQVMLARAAARANHLFIAAADRAGVERGQPFTHGSGVIDTDGWVVATPDPSGLAVADIVIATAGDRTLSEVNHVVADRRPELYLTLHDQGMHHQGMAGSTAR